MDKLYFSDRHVQSQVKHMLIKENIPKVTCAEELAAVIRYSLEGGTTRDQLNVVNAYVEYTIDEIISEERLPARQSIQKLNESSQLFRFSLTRELIAYCYAIADWF